MTKTEAKTLAKSIDSSISGEGISQSSGLFEICRETVDEISYVGLVDVSLQRNDETGEEEYNVYSIACEDGGDAICEPEWDVVYGSLTALSDAIMRLAHDFRRSEIERLVAAK